MRALKIVGVIILLLAAFVFYTFYSTGYFRTITDLNKERIHKTIDLKGAEDMTISYVDSFLLISSTDRRNLPAKGSSNGGLYLMDLRKPDSSPMLLSSSFEAEFAPHGISMFRIESGVYRVMAINHTSAGHSIESFMLSDFTLTHERTYSDPTMVSPNDLVMTSANTFYFTNDHGYTGGFGRLIEDYGGLALSNVVYFDGANRSEGRRRHCLCQWY